VDCGACLAGASGKARESFSTAAKALALVAREALRGAGGAGFAKRLVDRDAGESFGFGDVRERLIIAEEGDANREIGVRSAHPAKPRGMEKRRSSTVGAAPGQVSSALARRA